MRFHTLEIADVTRETAGCVSIAFKLPDALREAYRYRPGQYLTLKTTLDGVELRRAYSICAAPYENELRVAIKRVDGGVFSTFANDRLAKGARLDVGTPDGRFTVAIDESAERDYVLIAAGSGITPVIAIAKAVLAGEPGSRVTLIYANRTIDSIVFREALEDLKNRHMGRFAVAHVLSRERQDTPLLDGRLDAAKLAGLAELLFEPASVDAFYLCGPADLVGTAKTALTALGAKPDAIHVELFAAPDAPLHAAKPASERRAGNARVTIVRDGVRQVFEMPFDGESVLDAGARNGIDLPHSCKGGVCATCRCFKRAGEIEMAANYSLEPWELEKGFVLACQSRPVTDELVLDFDEA